VFGSPRCCLLAIRPAGLGYLLGAHRIEVLRGLDVRLFVDAVLLRLSSNFEESVHQGKAHHGGVGAALPTRWRSAHTDISVAVEAGGWSPDLAHSPCILVAFGSRTGSFRGLSSAPTHVCLNPKRVSGKTPSVQKLADHPP